MADHIWTYMARGGLYALTSACALFAGYIMQKSGFDWHDLPYLAVPIVASVYFFMCYSSRFPTRESGESSERATGVLIETEAINFFPVVAALLLIISLLVRYTATQSISFPLLIAFGLYVAMYAAYGRFLLRHPSSGDIPIVRHRLVWPVILSIGLGLYYGITFSSLSTSAAVLLPPILILILFVASEIAGFSTLVFSIVNILVSLAAVVLVVLARTGVLSLPFGLENYLSVVLFCITVSAYLAVFETWQVTSDIAVRSTNEAVSTPDRPMPKAVRYSTGALAALMLSVWLMPLLFVFSQYGTVFLVGFLVHATAAFIVWYVFGQGNYLRSKRWGAIKISAGVMFLVLVVLAWVFRKQPSTHLIKWIVKTEFMGILLVPVLWLVGKLWLNLLRERRKPQFLKRVLINRVNFVRVLSLLCWIACAILMTLLSTYAEDSPEYYKAELAFDAYVGCIVVCVIVEVYDRLTGTPLMMSLSNLVVGLLYLSRAITTILLGLCVFLPALIKGNSVWASASYALPFMLAAIGGFGLNDYFDSDKDLINKPYRAIPSGRLSRMLVFWISLTLLLSATASSIYVSSNWLQFGIYLLTISGVAFYNLFVKYVSLSKTVLTSLVSSLPICFSVLTFEYPGSYAVLPVATTFFVLGREWLMDIKDVKGDSKSGIQTFAMRLGPERTARVGFLFQVIAVILLLPIAALLNSSFAYLLVAFILMSVVLLYHLWMSPSGKHQTAVIRFLWAPMFLGILMLAA